MINISTFSRRIALTTAYILIEIRNIRTNHLDREYNLY